MNTVFTRRPPPPDPQNEVKTPCAALRWRGAWVQCEVMTRHLFCDRHAVKRTEGGKGA